MVEQGQIPPVKRLRNNLVARAELVGKLALPVAPLANAVLPFPSQEPAGWPRRYSWYPPRSAIPQGSANQRYSTWFRRHPRSLQRLQRKVLYFHGCSTEYYEPRIREKNSGGASWKPTASRWLCRRRTAADCRCSLMVNSALRAATTPATCPPGGIRPPGYTYRRHLYQLYPHTERTAPAAAGHAR